MKILDEYHLQLEENYEVLIVGGIEMLYKRHFMQIKGDEERMSALVSLCVLKDVLVMDAESDGETR